MERLRGWRLLRQGNTLFFVVVPILLLSACATQPDPPPTADHVPGLIYGFLHGYIALFSLVISLFTDTRIYAYPNAGFLYDLGFLAGLAFFLYGGRFVYRRKWRSPGSSNV